MADLTRYRYECIHGGIVVASVESPDDQRAKAEIMHYAAQYAQDGPCVVKRCRPVKPRASKKKRKPAALTGHETGGRNG
jgi:hypothetical protein